MSTALINEEKTPGCYLKARYVLGLMTALGTLNVYSERNGINVAIVPMAFNLTSGNLTAPTVNCTGLETEYCSNITRKNEQNTSPYQKGDFDWTIQQQTLVLGCYYYGYCLTNVPGAWLAKRFGIRLVLGLTSLFSSLLTLAMPIAAKTSLGVIIGLRIVMGFAQGVTFPTCMTGWGIWAPPLERSRLIATTFSGVSTGIFIVYPFVGLVISRFGWEASFYITGALGILYSLVFLAIIHDSPAVHPRISTQERDYIEVSIYGEKKPKEKRSIPWLSIAKSLPVWATIFAHEADSWATISMITLAPTYLANVHGFDIKSVAFLSALPFLVRFFVMMLGSLLTDLVICKGWARIVVMRKIMSSIPLLVAAVAMISMAYVGRRPWVAVGLLCTSIAILGFTTSGHISTFVNIAPRYSGVLYSISNTIASIIGFVAPQVAGAFIKDQQASSSWQGVFWLSAVICLIGAAMFGIFATDRVQPWAEMDASDSKKEKEELLICNKREEKL